VQRIGSLARIDGRWLGVVQSLGKFAWWPLGGDGDRRMKFMLLIYADEHVWTEPERQACYGESTDLAHGLASAGQFIAASPLQSVSTAKSVRVRDGKRVITDGPFAETREQLGGFFMIDAHDFDEAVEIAGRIPGARKGTVEVRPVVELANLPSAVDHTRAPAA
jgi:hypothetical protein